MRNYYLASWCLFYVTAVTAQETSPAPAITDVDEKGFLDVHTRQNPKPNRLQPSGYSARAAKEVNSL